MASTAASSDTYAPTFRLVDKIQDETKFPNTIKQLQDNWSTVLGGEPPVMRVAGSEPLMFTTGTGVDIPFGFDPFHAKETHQMRDPDFNPNGVSAVVVAVSENGQVQMAMSSEGSSNAMDKLSDNKQRHKEAIRQFNAKASAMVLMKKAISKSKGRMQKWYSRTVVPPPPKKTPASFYHERTKHFVAILNEGEFAKAYNRHYTLHPDAVLKLINKEDKPDDFAAEGYFTTMIGGLKVVFVTNRFQMDKDGKDALCGASKSTISEIIASRFDHDGPVLVVILMTAESRKNGDVLSCKKPGWKKIFKSM